MMITKLARILFILLLSVLSSLVIVPRAAAAPNLTLSPATATLNNNSSTQVNILIDVESQNAFGADAILTVPSSDFDVTTITNGGFFTDFNWVFDTAHNRLEIHGFFSTLYQTKSGSGTLATVTLKAKKDAGTDTVPFVCDGTSTGSQILDGNGHNILNCTNVNTLSVTFAGASPSATPTPTPSPTPTSTPQPTATPAPAGSNYSYPTCDGLVAAPASGKKPLAVTMTCTGESQHNDITAAEFNFGNGQVQLVSKNVGSFGTISTSYTYPTEGFFGASCRLMDNNSVFSATPDACRKTIIVTATSLAARIVRASTIKPQIVELVPYVPASAPAQIITPIPTFAPVAAEEENPWSRYFLGGGIMAFSILVGLWLIGKSRGGPKPPTPPEVPPAPPMEEYSPRTEGLPPIEEIPPVTETSEESPPQNSS